MYLPSFTLEATRAFASRSWSGIGFSRSAENSPDPPAEQKMQPRVPRVPSRLGQVTSAERAMR